MLCYWQNRSVTYRKAYMKARYALSLISTFLISSGLNLQAQTQPGLIDLAAGLTYGLVGYQTMSVSKWAGKETTDKVLHMDHGILRGVTALDLKFVWNAALKCTLKSGSNAFFVPLQFKDIGTNTPVLDRTGTSFAPAAFRGHLFDAANKAVSLTEFLFDCMPDVINEFNRITLPPSTSSIKLMTVGATKPLANTTAPVINDGNKTEPRDHELVKLTPTSRAYLNIVEKMNDAAEYFYNTALAITTDPRTAITTATYLFAAWRICMFTRGMGDQARNFFGSPRIVGGIEAPAFFPIFAKGNDPFDRIMQTTIGFTFSSLLQAPGSAFLNSTYGALGWHNERAHKLYSFAWKAGTKMAFAIDGANALRAGIATFLAVTSMWMKQRVLKTKIE